jgi:co-chaperonin GroES (HSP10)
MKTFNFFVVELKQLINDTIKTDSGLELYIDTRFEMGEFEYRITEGPVVAAPFKYDTGVEPGDTLYFHHLVVMQGGQPLTGDDDHYIVKYDPEAINSQAIAFKSKETGEIKTLGGWTLLEAVEEEGEETTSDLIETVVLKDKLPTKGRLVHGNEETEYMGLNPGDVVGFAKNRDYRIKIEGKEYYRTRAEDLLYVEEEVHND